jgi:hypothetical protein
MIDEEFARITREEIRGFAGYYLNEHGEQVVMLVDESQRAAAVRLVAEQRRHAGMAQVAILVRHARYDFLQLWRWSNTVTAFMAADGGWALDVDEVNNRLWLAVAEPQKVGRLRADILRAGVPGDAFTIELRARPAKTMLLTQAQRPVMGGFEIEGYRWGGIHICTLGFNMRVNGYAGFATATHCSKERNSLDGGSVTQGDTTAPVANEVFDTQGELICLQAYGFRCRWSEASIFRYFGTVPSDLGRIAKPIGNEPFTIEALVIDNEHPYFTITRKLDSPTDVQVGTPIDKVGRSSGWTTGYVTRTCVTVDSGIRYWCQELASTFAQEGDSGAPMFVVEPDGLTVGLRGLLWAHDPGSGGTFYSPISGIERDFGVTLTVTVAGGGDDEPPPPPPGGCSDPSQIVC